jgi:hypothetical protein
MTHQVSTEAMSSWNEVVRLWHSYFEARGNLASKHRSELPALLIQVLRSPSDGHLAFEMTEILTPEEKQTLLPVLMSLCSSERDAGRAKPMILAMPRQ